jgi:hypothetical protein
MAWIDQTGFYGKMNGLWLLNGQSGTSLDFIQLDQGRPYNFMVVAENGNGQWAPNYAGAEHFEIPHSVREPNDANPCDATICNWYSLNEAAKSGRAPNGADSGIPQWWSCSSQGRMSWAQLNVAALGTETSTSLALLYRAPVTKEGDNDGSYDGDACHMNMLFADGFRRPVYLNVGYLLHGDLPYFERLYAYENPASNNANFNQGELQSHGSLIHGIVATKIYGGIAEKLNLRKNLYLHEGPWRLPDPFGSGGTQLQAGQWHGVEPQAGEPGVTTWDRVFGWMSQAVTFSSDQTNNPGKALVITHQGLYDNDNTGFCSCVVYNGLEISGAVLNATEIPPIAPGTYSVLARKKLMFPQGTAFFAETNGYKGADYKFTDYAANGALSALENGVGFAVGNEWAVQHQTDGPGYMIYGPYQVFGNASFGSNNNAEAYALFKIGIADVPASLFTPPIVNVPVMLLEVYDTTTGTTIAERVLRLANMGGLGSYREYALPFDLHYGGVDRTSHVMETRAYWYDKTSHLTKRVTILKPD